jgi:arginyl-tRNA synthetase
MTTATGGPGSSGPSDPWQPILDALLPVLAERLKAAGASVEPGWIESQLDIAGGEEWDIALALHRPAQSAARSAEELARALSDGFPATLGVRAVAPLGGYLNFSLDAGWFAEETLRIVRARGARFGHGDRPGPAACVEHTSANPTGPFHVGRVRNGIIGDTLARVLRAAGAPVTTQYYVDDVGRQAAMVTWIWSKPVSEWPPEIRASLDEVGGRVDPTERADQRYGRPYPSVSTYLKTHPEAAAEVSELSRRLEAGEAPPLHRELSEAVLGGMLRSLARIAITFDEVVWESSFLRDGSVERVVARLAVAPHAVREENGALAIDTASYGLPKEKARVVVTRADATSLYATRDIAYHLAKFARFPRVIDVLGQDHRLHARSLEALLAEIGEARRPEFVIYQDLTVPEGGRMSTRKGTAVNLDALLDEAVERARREVRSRWEEVSDEEVDEIAVALASGAVRYHILRVAPDKTVSFRWEDALSFEGRSGPFVQYAYVRATSLLKKATDATPPYAFRGADLLTPEERALVRAIARLPRVVAYAARTAHVHTVAGYAHDLAEEFNRFYQSVPVLKAREERASRLALVAAARETLGNVLDLLGLERLARM